MKYSHIVFMQIQNSPLNLDSICVLLIEGRSLYEYTLMSYVLNVSPLIITSSSIIDILLVPILVVELMTMTYPLVCDDIVQLTLILVSFKIYAIILDGGPLGTRK